MLNAVRSLSLMLEALPPWLLAAPTLTPSGASEVTAINVRSICSSLSGSDSIRLHCCGSKPSGSR